MKYRHVVRVIDYTYTAKQFRINRIIIVLILNSNRISIIFTSIEGGSTDTTPTCKDHNMWGYCKEENAWICPYLGPYQEDCPKLCGVCWLWTVVGLKSRHDICFNFVDQHISYPILCLNFNEIFSWVCKFTQYLFIIITIYCYLSITIK